jgi:ubiquinone/menaquinone biosynthesis C-methylase UbiE
MSSPALHMTASSWTTAAPGYNNLFVPRFAPWTNIALTHLKHEHSSRDQGGGIALVPCCGPGQELIPLAEIVGTPVVGVDIAPGMVDICIQRTKYSSQVTAIVGDAAHPPPGPYSAVLSVFGLQQLADPVSALEAWVRPILPGGIAVIVYWPRNVEVNKDGPFARFSTLVKEKLNIQTNTTANDTVDWEDELVAAAQRAGAQVLHDETIASEIQWEDPDQFWNAMTRSGPWHRIRLTRGDEFVDGLKREYCSIYPTDRPVLHSPSARLLVFRKSR